MVAISSDFLQQAYANINTPPQVSEYTSEPAPEDLQKTILDTMQSGIESLRNPYDQNPDMLRYLQPFSFALTASDYRTWKDQIVSILSSQFSDTGEYLADEKAGHIKYYEMLGDFNAGNAAFTSYSFTDTSLGGNEAINCRWGFCRDDDIIQPINAFNGKPELGGMGRVYYETYESNAQYLYITAGVPEFNYLWKFYSEAIDGDIASDVNNGGWSGIVSAIFGCLGSFLGTALTLPFTAVKYGMKIADIVAGNRESVTKYYDFRSAMPMYYRYANSMLVHICTNLGLYPSATLGDDYQYGNAGTVGNQKKISAVDVWSSQKGSKLTDSDLPDFLQKGVSLYRILSKRDARNGLNKALRAQKSGDQFPEDAILEANRRYLKSARSDVIDSEVEEGFWQTFWGRHVATATGADKYICFRLDKGTEATETFSNQTGQSTIQQTLNGMVSQGKNLNFSMMGGKLANIPGVSQIVGAVKDFSTGILNQVGVTNVASAVLTGSGFFDIPEVWTGSSYSKSYSFSMTFRAPYGDSQTITQSIYVPLCLLLPLTCPRTVGQNAYTSPFVIRAYAKGMFAIPLGIIDSMSITRGASEFGWNINKLPLVMKINFSIKDLSPLMHMALHNQGLWDTFFGSNSNFNEYLMTLEGLGIQERTLFMTSFIRRLEVKLNEFKQGIGSPAIFGGTMFGNFTLSKVIGAFYPDSAMPS